MSPLVSVIIPAYNSQATLADAVASVLAQSLGDFELIVIDDGSSDDTLAIARSFSDARIEVVAAPHSGLPAVARNLGLQVASGEYVAFLDSDDTWQPTKLERQLALFSASPEVGAVHCGAVYLVSDEPDAVPLSWRLANPAPPARVLAELLRRNTIYTPSMVVRRALLERVGGFDPDPRLRGPEDLDLWLRLAEQGAWFGYLAEPQLVYRVRAGSVSRMRLTDLQGTAVAIERALTRRPGTYRLLRGVARRRLSDLYRNLGALRIAAGDRCGYSNLTRSFRYRSWSWKTWSWLAIGLLGARTSAAVHRWRNAAAGSVRGQAGDRR